MNRTIVFLAVLAALAIGIFYFLNYVQPPGGGFSDTTGVNKENLIHYRNAEGFEFDYPYYFKVDEQPSEYPDLKAAFVAVYPDTVEIIQAARSNESADQVESEIASILRTEEKNTLIQGKTSNARITMYQTNWFGGKAYSRFALFSCGSDTRILHMVIPVAFQQDLKTANYITSTFKC